MNFGLDLTPNIKSLVLLLAINLWIHADSWSQHNVLSQPVEIKAEQVSVHHILNDLEERYGIQFTYKYFDASSLKTLHYQGNLKDLLDELFADENIVYKSVGTGIILRQNRVIGQKIKGKVVDEITGAALIGATVSVVNSINPTGTSTDINGRFVIGGLFIGRYDLEVQYLGYKTSLISQVLVSSGKEVHLTVRLRESVLSLHEIVVVAKHDYTKPFNDMATSSARSFSVEETQRYAAAISDPARMVQSFAGVSSGGDDLSNEILVRGNSARGMLWRLEGVEIPNPNHFAGYVSGGGAISMLSSSTLADSDFFTGAFPAEYGNALSGVFDLKLRNGNTDQREHTLAIGNIGLEASSEGYFSKTSDASYLFNFRYSTLELIDQFLPTLQGNLPAYRDLSFKVNLPTARLGTFSLFGLGGSNLQTFDAVADSTKWKSFRDEVDYREEQGMGLIGLSHRKILNKRSYLKNTILVSGYYFRDLYERLYSNFNYAKAKYDGGTFDNTNVNWALQYNLKINSKNAIRTGMSLNAQRFNYFFETKDPLVPLESSTPSIQDELISYINSDGQTLYTQMYAQWQYRPNDQWEWNLGLNISILWLNRTLGLDPRLGVKYHLPNGNTLHMAIGLHSKPDHSSTYFLIPQDHDGGDFPNINLSMLKAWHLVMGYDIRFSEKLRLKLENYFQYLFDIPVSSSIESGFSILNTRDIFNIVFDNQEGKGILVSQGRGINYGMDLTLEKFFSDGYYFLMTGSVFDSKYSPLNRKWYPTFAANNVLFNLLGGKEWILKKRKKNILGINGKFTYYGGRRDHPIDLEASIKEGREVQIPNQYYTARMDPYIRFDIGLVFRFNTLKTTHSLHLDIQNLFNRYNVAEQFFDPSVNRVLKFTQNGLIPFFTYRVQFSSSEKETK